MLVQVDWIVIACRCHDRNLHARLDARFQMNVLVEIDIRPEVHKLDNAVAAADAVDAAESLDDAHGIPVDVVVHKVVAVLEILPFGNAVRCNQEIDIRAIGRPSAARSFEMGEKHVKISLKSLPTSSRVVLPPPVPVMSAVSMPHIAFTNGASSS